MQLALFNINTIDIAWDRVPTTLFDVTAYDRPAWAVDMRGRHAFRNVLALMA